MKIIGFDPGTARVGWAVVIYSKSSVTQLSYGCFTTPAHESEEVRLLAVFTDVSRLIKTEKPDIISIEEIFFSTNAKTAIPVSQARGVILLSCAVHTIPVVSYSPRTIKRALTGDGNADKIQVQTMLMRLLKLKSIPKPDDAADAIAIALTHAYSSPLKNSYI